MLVFRIATQADVLLLASMNERLMRDEGNRSRLTRRSLEPRMSRWLSGDYRAAIFSLNREPIGYALWKPKSDHVHLRQYYVEPAYRRKGYGKAGIEMLMNNLWGEFARVRLEVLVGNDTGLRFWKFHRLRGLLRNDGTTRLVMIGGTRSRLAVGISTVDGLHAGFKAPSSHNLLT